MRILVVSCRGIAAERPLQWMVEAEHEVCLVGDADFYDDRHPANYRFFASQSLIERKANLERARDENHMAHTMAPRLRQIADEFQPDLVHVNAIGWHSYSCALAELRPLVVSAWGFLNFLLARPMGKQDDRSQYVLEHTDALIVENPKLVEPARALLPPQAQIELIPLGAKVQAFRRGATRDIAKWKQQLFNLPEDTLVLLSPRGLSRTYCHEAIYQAYELAYSKFNKPTAIAFCTMGRGAFEQAKAIYESINKQAEAANLRDRLRWLPHFPHLWMPTLYNLADVVVNYPYRDAFPSTLIEAVACECAVISSDLFAYRDTFVEQFCTLASANNPPALAEAMIQVVNQPASARRDRLAEARQLIVEQFDEAILKQRFLQTCEQVAQGAKPMVEAAA